MPELPNAEKHRWIRANLADRPTISPDVQCREFKVSPTDRHEPVVVRARQAMYSGERAIIGKVYSGDRLMVVPLRESPQELARRPRQSGQISGLLGDFVELFPLRPEGRRS